MIPELSLLAALAGGLLILGLSGDLLIRGAEGFCSKLGVSPLLVGIFVVGIGTSAPEMFISVKAVLDGAPGLAVGNIVGSNIANILLVPVLPALLFRVDLGGRNQPLALLAMLAASAAWVYVLISGALTQTTALFFVIALAAFSLVLVLTMSDHEDEEEDGPPPSIFMAFVFTAAGVIGLPLGAHLAISGGAGIARELGISEAIIGLTLLAVGTSLPEVSAATAAALRRQTDMLVGNILGSNTFNILAAGGVVALFGPVDIDDTFANYDLWIMSGAALLFAILILFRVRINRLGGLILGLFYLAYIAGLVLGWNILEPVERLIGG